MNININDLTLGQIKELGSMLNNPTNTTATLNSMVGQHVIIRTYSAGVWFGVLDQKAGNEVIIKNARRMRRWKVNQSITLSGAARYGIDQEKSKIVDAVDAVWLEAIEIIPCTKVAIKSIGGAKNVEAV